MFPVVVLDGQNEIPNDDIFYIVAKNGIFMRKNFGFFDTISKVDKISILEECSPYANLNIAKIPGRKFTQILSLFRDVYQKYKGECNVILHYNPKRKRYRIDIPPQGVSGGTVEYRNGEETYKDYVRIGTIHSHASMSAFHSGTDHNDEINWDGLHITLGYMNRDYFNISCSVMAHGKRYMVNPEDYIEGIEMGEFEIIPQFKRFIVTNGIREEKPNEKTLGYISTQPPKDYKYPKDWMTKVDKYKPRPIVPPTTGSTNPRKINADDIKFLSDLSHFSRQQQTLFDQFDDAVPCHKCPYRHHKSELLMQDVFDSMDDDELDTMGFVEINPNDVDEKDDFSCNIDDPDHDGPTFGNFKKD